MNRSRDEILRIVRFIAIGGLAALTHISVSLLVLHFARVQPAIANIFGFCAAFFVSLWGQTYITFRAGMSAGVALRFTVVALFGVALSTIAVALLDAGTLLPDRVVVVCGALVSPVFSYLANALWTFRRTTG